MQHVVEIVKKKTAFLFFNQIHGMECESDDVFMDILSFVLLLFFITSNKNCMNVANDGFLLNYVPLKSEYPLMFC